MRKTIVLWAFLGAGFLVWAAGFRPFDYDEIIHAHFSWLMAGGFKPNPVFDEPNRRLAIRQYLDLHAGEYEEQAVEGIRVYRRKDANQGL